MNDGALTEQEMATNAETWKHIHRVQQLLTGIASELVARAVRHDQSKLRRPEVEYFAKHTKALHNLTYGSDAYKAELAAMKPALDHHYAKNSHHPEHYPDGVDGMTILDVVEMLCDWKAATERHADGNIQRSIDHNSVRFKLSPQLTRIFRNSIGMWEK